MARKPDPNKKDAERGRAAPAGHEDPGSDTSPDARLVNALETDPAFFKDPLIGTTLGKCNIEKYIGEGKTAIVYRAQYQPLKRTVAVKVLQSAMTEIPAVLRVFQQEGRAVAAIDHGNVLKIYDVGEDRGFHYMVLELLRGKNLLEIIEAAEGGRLPVEEALHYTKQAAKGLGAAHRKNLVHRDIKPQNLVIEPGGTLKIVDFGLAAESEGAFSGGRLGTPHYMSTEQCRGEHASNASDIYSLGITLFHMLVGHPPYSGLQTKEAIIAEHLKARKLEPEKLRPDLPRPVADLVRRMTRADAALRPLAAEVFDLIDKIEAGKGGKADAVRRGGRHGRGARQSGAPPVGLIAGGGILVLLVIVLLMSSGKSPAPEPAGTEAAQAPAPPPDPKPARADPKGPAAKAGTLDEQLQELFAQAEQEEKTGNNREAQYLYNQVLLKAPEGSAWARRAKAAAVALKELIDAGAGPREKKVYISVGDSARAGEEFAGRRPEWNRRLALMESATVRAEMEAFVQRTRAESPERLDVEAALRLVGYIEGLLEMASTRGHTLSAGKERWSRYDIQASGDLAVVGADAAGVRVADTSEEQAQPTARPWASLAPRTVIRFLDALRNEQSPRENLWLGFYCTLVGSDLAETYFSNALVLEDGAPFRAEIEAARAP
ncbi:MAG: serine/threonine-protein kinase [Planctomycetaceae bacterium]